MRRTALLTALTTWMAGTALLAAGPAPAETPIGQRATTVIVDDRDLAPRGAWRGVSTASAHAGTLSKSTDKGARLTTRGEAEAGGSVTVQVGPKRGRIAIYVGGTRQKTVSTAAATKAVKRIRFSGAGVVRVQVAEPRRGVYVDAVRLTQHDTPPAPAPGEVVITEVMADPAAVPDATGEWVELTNVADGPRDLTSCLVSNQSAEASALPTATLLAGAMTVTGRSTDPLLNGGSNASTTFTFPLAETGSFTLACGGTVVDTTAWPSSQPGVGRSLDPAATDAAANDLDASWCGATTVYGDGDAGSPGAPNEVCPSSPTAPGAGDLVITEVMANPAAVDDINGEWFEVVNVTDAVLDTSGCHLTNQVAATSAFTAFGVVPPGPIAMARNGNTVSNGGVPADGTYSLALVNTGGSLSLICGEVLVDTVTWPGSTSGVARSLSASTTDATLNDAEGSWCLATTSYGQGDIGTPSDMNPSCP